MKLMSRPSLSLYPYSETQKGYQAIAKSTSPTFPTPSCHVKLQLKHNNTPEARTPP
jgi:hypothetical protein